MLQPWKGSVELQDRNVDNVEFVMNYSKNDCVFLYYGS